jgi:LDH2 family malate/lactate/ureidoglycolate dehydrogenase
MKHNFIRQNSCSISNVETAAQESHQMSNKTTLIHAGVLIQACERLLIKAGVPADQAAVIAQIIVEADLRGIESHGILRLPTYIHRIQAGTMSASTELVPLYKRGATLLLDAQGGFGQIAAVHAMNEAISRAEIQGTGFVAVRNAGHFGIAAYYAMMALPHMMIGIVSANAAPSMAAWGGTIPLLGTNPICVAIPTGTDVDIVLDMASSIVARGKIRLAASKGQSIPLGWALDANGQPTEDPEAAMEGTLLPIGGPKGYGLALVIDILSGVLTGSSFGSHVAATHELDRKASTGFVVQALDITAFLRDMQSLIAEIRNSPRASGVDKIYLPGEIEWLKKQERVESGIPVPESLLAALKKLAQELDVELGWPEFS